MCSAQPARQVSAPGGGGAQRHHHQGGQDQAGRVEGWAVPRRCVVFGGGGAPRAASLRIPPRPLLQLFPRAPRCCAKSLQLTPPPCPAHLTHTLLTLPWGPLFAAAAQSKEDKAKGGAYGLYAAFFSARPTVFKEPVAARPLALHLTQNTLCRFSAPSLFAAAAAQPVIASLKVAAAAANPPTQEQLEFLERVHEVRKQERLKKAGGGQRPTG